jgi:hypothetical protein
VEIAFLQVNVYGILEKRVVILEILKDQNVNQDLGEKI